MWISETSPAAASTSCRRRALLIEPVAARAEGVAGAGAPEDADVRERGHERGAAGEVGDDYSPKPAFAAMRDFVATAAPVGSQRFSD